MGNDGKIGINAFSDLLAELYIKMWLRRLILFHFLYLLIMRLLTIKFKYYFRADFPISVNCLLNQHLAHRGSQPSGFIRSFFSNIFARRSIHNGTADIDNKPGVLVHSRPAYFSEFASLRADTRDQQKVIRYLPADVGQYTCFCG